MNTDTIRVCDHCSGVVEENTTAEHSYCTDCRVIEGGDTEMTIDEFNDLQEQKFNSFVENNY